MGRLKKVILLFISTIIIFMSMGVNAFADRKDVDSVVFIAKNQTELLSICTTANNVAGKKILVYTGNDGLLTFSNSAYSELTVDIRRDFMETALLGVKESGIGSQMKNKVYNFIANQDTTTSAAMKFLRSDTSADFAKASAWFKPFGSTIGVVLGLLSLLIFMFIGLSTLIDIAYMSLPAFRLLVEGGKDGKPRLISVEAYTAVKESETGTNYKGYMSIYFNRRIPSILIMSICLGYLISGKIYSIIVYIIDAFTWIF